MKIIADVEMGMRTSSSAWPSLFCVFLGLANAKLPKWVNLITTLYQTFTIFFIQPFASYRSPCIQNNALKSYEEHVS